LALAKSIRLEVHRRWNSVEVSAFRRIVAEKPYTLFLHFLSEFVYGNPKP